MWLKEFSVNHRKTHLAVSIENRINNENKYPWSVRDSTFFRFLLDFRAFAAFDFGGEVAGNELRASTNTIRKSPVSENGLVTSNVTFWSS